MLKNPPDIARQLAGRYDREWVCWLRGEGHWPLRIPLGSPTDPDWKDGASSIRGWIDAWKNVGGQGEVLWETRTYRNRGGNRLPVSIAFCNAENVARWIGRGSAWLDAVALRERLLSEWPIASGPVETHLAELLGWERADIDRLVATVNWIAEHPNSGLYRRAIPVRGIHTKWLEARIGIVRDFVVTLIPGLPAGDKLACLGLKGPPWLVRWRLLCPRLRMAMGGIDSLATSVAELAEFRFLPERVIILENLETMLSLPDLEDCVAILGQGYAIENLSAIPWLKEIPLGYWGDLDTHGFAILDRIRAIAPQTTSLLMDRETLVEFADLWTFESDQHNACSFSRLTAEENSLFKDLRENKLGIGVRLEQERVPLDWAQKYLLDWLH